MESSKSIIKQILNAFDTLELRQLKNKWQFEAETEAEQTHTRASKMTTAWERSSQRRLEFNFSCNHAGTLFLSLSLRVRNKWSWSRMGGTQVGVAVGEKPYHLFDGVCQPAKLHLWVVNTARCKLLQTIRFLLSKFPFAPNWNFRKIYNQSLGQQRNARKHIGKFEKILKLCCNRFPNEMVRYWRGANEKKKWGKIKTKDLISPAKRRIYMFAPLRNKFFPFSIFFPAPKRFALSISSPLWKYKIFSIFDFIFRFFFFWNAGVCRHARWCHKIKQKTE